MAESGRPEPLHSFLDRCRSELPAVVEVAEGIYGSQERSSESRDFSNGDILRLLSVSERVTVTVLGPGAGAGPSRPGHPAGLLTLDQDFRGALFLVVSDLADGHIYSNFDQLFDDAPQFVHATTGLTLPAAGDGTSPTTLQAGDRMKLLEKSQGGGERWIRCRNLRTGHSFRLSRRLIAPPSPAGVTPFAKRVSHSQPTVNLAELYPLLPQRVRPVRDQGQVMRGEPAVPGLEPVDYSGELLLDRAEVVKTCTWEDPDVVFEIAAATDVCVLPRPDWAGRVDPVEDVQVVAGQASPDQPRMAVVVDQESRVPGCPKDTLLVIHGLQEAKFLTLRCRNQRYALVHREYPSLFKATVETWPTVRDFLNAGVGAEVNVGTTARLHSDGALRLDVLYEHDLIRATDDSKPELLMPVGAGGTGHRQSGVMAVRLYRSQSLRGKLGEVQVALDLRANLHRPYPLLGDNRLAKILNWPEMRLPVPVTLSRPQALGRGREELHPSDDLLMQLSPLSVVGVCQVPVAVVSAVSARRGLASGSAEERIFVPVCRPLAVRALTNPPVGPTSKAPAGEPLVPPTAVIALSESELNALEGTEYLDVCPPVPKRSGAPDVEDRPPPLSPPPRPPKPLGYRQQPKSPTRPTSEAPLSSIPSPNTRRSLPRVPSLKINKILPRRKPSSPDVLAHPQRRPPITTPTENPYNPGLLKKFVEDTSIYESVSSNSDSDGDDSRDYETPDIIPQLESPEIPPKDGDVSRFGPNQMIQLLEFLDVSPGAVNTFRRRHINGARLVELRRSCTDDLLRKELGLERHNDWFALLCFIEKSSGKT